MPPDFQCNNSPSIETTNRQHNIIATLQGHVFGR